MKKRLCLLLAVALTVVLTACGNAADKAKPTATVQATQPTVSATQAPTKSPETQEMTAVTQAPQTEPTPAETAAPEIATEIIQEEPSSAGDLQMLINGTAVAVAWEDNAAVDTLKELCNGQTLTIDMSMYGGFEQVGSIGTQLPRDDVQTTTEAGDIMLYAGDQMVVFYGSNSWAYTRLGRITDNSQAQLSELLSGGNVTITLTY
ncbi:cyclophilin-like fold protein [Ruminococcus sp.]|uniref:cyclophilin-like fold protein n=1 Tax=Ruminococcus sp. TaxID=41978 RepID=UPI00386ACAED